MFGVENRNGVLTVYVNGRAVIRHSSSAPFIAVGKTDRPGEKAAKPALLRASSYDEARAQLRFSGGGQFVLFALSDFDGALALKLHKSSPGIGFVRMDFPSGSQAHVYGGGQQYISESMHGRRYYMRVLEDAADHIKIHWPGMRSGFGLHRRTSYPQPTFLNGDMTLYHFDTPLDCVLDFKTAGRCRAEMKGLPDRLIIAAEKRPSDAVKSLTAMLGGQPAPPQWCSAGVWIDVQGGCRSLEDSLSKAASMGVKVSCVILRDWSGRLSSAKNPSPFWDWEKSPELYPELEQCLAQLRGRDIRALGYINPHLSIEGRFFAEASNKAYLLRRRDGGVYISNVGGVMAGHLDLLNPAAVEWYQKIIENNLLKTGFSGYIADMGGFLPEDAALHDGACPQDVENLWPVMWAKLNREVIDRQKDSDQLALILRSGFSGTSRHASFICAPDRRAAWGTNGGLSSALNASLSLAWSGVGASYSIIGGARPGFLTFDGRELMMRWSEYAAFTPVMHAVFGAHGRGLCVDEDVETMRHFSHMAAVHCKLSPYISACLAENAKHGIPVMRPMHMAFQSEKPAARMHGEYMLGPDLLVAPVLTRGRRERSVVFPKGVWVNIWSGKEYKEGRAFVPAPLGKPPVFFRNDSRYADFFRELKLAGKS